MTASVTLHEFDRADLPTVAPWFADPDTRRFLGGPDWPGRMLDVSARTVGQPFRGAVQTAAVHYLARVDGDPVGYLDCGTFDRWSVYAGEGPDGPIIVETRDIPTGYLALCVDPARRGHGIGRAMLAALPRRPELAGVQRFAAGVDADNHPSRRCLHAAGFRPDRAEPDFEDILYYVHDRS